MTASVIPENYDLSSGTLRIVSSSSETSYNLSHLQIQSIAENSLDSLTNAEALDLSNNDLETLPPLIFSKLVNLKYLSLANNRISSFTNVFIGLTSLLHLDLSGNSLSFLKKGDLFGLSQHVELNVERNPITKISTRIFEEPEPIENDVIETIEEKRRFQPRQYVDCDLRQNSDDIVEFLGDCELTDVSTPFGTHVHAIIHPGTNITTLMLTERAIGGFKPGWYNVRHFVFDEIFMSTNAMKNLSPELINELPPLKRLTITCNGITEIKDDGFENDNPISLDLSNNLISTIEDGAFKKLNLEGLYLSSNRLINTSFVTTLPTSITELIINSNAISTDGILQNSFNHLRNLKFVSMKNNKIEFISEVFKNLENLTRLELLGNQIQHLSPRIFQGSHKLEYVDLSQNKIDKIPTDFFSDWGKDGSLEVLLPHNPIVTIEPGVFSQKSLASLHLPLLKKVGNESREGDTYSGISADFLDGSKISKLTMTFTGTEIHGEWLKGISGIEEVRLWIAGMKVLERGITEHLGSITKLLLFVPHLEVIDNGSLFGLSTDEDVMIYFYNARLQIIRGGLFNDYREFM